MIRARRTTRSLWLLVLSVSTAIVAGCAALQPAAIVENYNTEATITAVRYALAHYHDALRARNTDKILEFFWPDTNFRVYDGEEGWLTYDNMRLQDAPAFRRLASVEIHIDSLYIAPLDPSAAVVADNLVEIFTDSSGRSRRLRLTQTMVWTRRADGWKIAHIHSSDRPDTTKR